MEGSSHLLEDVDIIRDPFSEPPKLINSDSVCLSIAMLQLLMASPSLMFKLYHHNYCSSLTCFQLKLNIPNNINKDMRWEKNIEYAYLVHEVLMMMGLRARDNEQKGFTCDNNVFSTGCDLKRDEQPVTMRSNCLVAGKKSKLSPSCSLIPTKIISVRNKLLEHPDLKHDDLTLLDDNPKGLWPKIVEWTSTNI
ncbi:hypothetical protein SNEBB_001884 [Seison nebaliae]|nr:hypothetical protein SNEBB_001884 [Seison nebaliae]